MSVGGSVGVGAGEHHFQKLSYRYTKQHILIVDVLLISGLLKDEVASESSKNALSLQVLLNTVNRGDKQSDNQR